MSKPLKIFFVVILVLVVIGVIYYFTKKEKTPVVLPDVDTKKNIDTPVNPERPYQVQDPIMKIVIGKGSFAVRDNVTVYNANNSVRKVLSKGDWAGTVLNQVGHVVGLKFSDESIGWVTDTDIYVNI